MERQFSPNTEVIEQDHSDLVEAYVDSFDENDNEDDDPIPPVTDQEVAASLAKLKARKAPGPDAVGSPALRRLPPWMISLLTAIFNSCLNLRYFPSPWKTAKIILIPKPGKNHLQPENHRPISLLPTLSKVLERIILSRFPEQFHLSIRSEQYGFRRGHSTTLQLTRVLNSTANAISQRKPTTTVLVDVSKAFDKVWHQGLLYKLAHSPLPRQLYSLLKSYLQGRRFSIAVGSALSTTRAITAGVPQGSVLGPLLYLWYTNDIPLAPRVQLSMFADDAMFQATSIQARMSTIYMQRQMDLLEPWLRKWRIKVNVAKCEAICFTRKSYGPVIRNIITLNNSPIPWKTTVKYLGVTLDRKLTMTQHVDKRRQLTIAGAACLSPLLRPTAPLTITTKVRLYTALLRPALTYAAPAWYRLASKSSKKKLQSVQNKILRRATNSPWFVRNTVIAATTGVEQISDFVAATTARMEETARSSEWAHIRAIPDQPTADLRAHHHPAVDDPP